MASQDQSPSSPTSPGRGKKQMVSQMPVFHIPPAMGSDETPHVTRRGMQSGCREVTLSFSGMSQERGDVDSRDPSKAEEETYVSESRQSSALPPDIMQDSKKDDSEDIYVKRRALVHSIYVRISDKKIDWTWENKFAEARYSHFRVAFAQVSLVMPIGVVALAINAGIFRHWLRVGILLGLVLPIYTLCAYIAFRHEQHFLRLSGTSGEKLLIGALCVQTLAIVLAEFFRPEIDYGMLTMHIGYLNNFTPMSAFSMQMVSAVFGLLPYCLAKIIAVFFFPWEVMEDTNHQVGDLAICTPADPRSEAQLPSSLLVPITIFLYQVLVTSVRDKSMRWDCLVGRGLHLKNQMLDSEQRKIEDMLSGMLPKEFIKPLKAAQMAPSSESIEPQYFQDVTVIFVEICDFAQLCSNIPARDVVEVLNVVYHEFDRLSDLLDVYKVETVAEVYMAVVGAPHPVNNHADVAAHFALALIHSMKLMRPRLDGLIKASKLHRSQSLPSPPPPPSDPAPLPAVSEISVPGMCNVIRESEKLTEPAMVPTRCPTASSDEDLPVLIRIGLNSGQLFAGVVGMESPRYKLVGDTVNTASRMESTCAQGKIQVSQTTKEKLTENMFILEDRGHIPVKGKGTMNTHYLLGYAGSETYETRKISIVGGMWLNSTDSNGIASAPFNSSSSFSRNRGRPAVTKGNDGGFELVRVTPTPASSRQDVEEDKVTKTENPIAPVLGAIGAKSWEKNPWLIQLLYFFLLVPASQKSAKRIIELNADKPYFLELKLNEHLEFARNLTIVIALAVSTLCIVDPVESGGMSFLGEEFSHHNMILVRDLGNSVVALVYVLVFSMFTLSRRMAQAFTIVMLLLQFAALLTAGLYLWDTERGIVAIIAMYGAYVLFYTVCTLLQRLAIIATVITTYVVLKATCCGDSSLEAFQNIAFLVIFIFSMTCSLGLQEHLSHVSHFEQCSANECLNQIKAAKSLGAQLLTNMLPSHVVDLVRDGVSPIAETYDAVTILFTDIKGFTKFSTSISPRKLCHVLNSMYSNFDEIISMWELHKVEIIGDAYWVSAGCPAKPCLQAGADDESAPSKTTDLQKERAEFAMRAVEVGLALLRALTSVCDDVSLQMRVGIHTGSVVAGVVGKNGPRYHLFGTTVGYAQKMESSGIPGRVQISDVTHTLLEAGGHAYDYEERTVDMEPEESPVRTWLVNKSNAKKAIHIHKKLMEERCRQLS